jgi:S-formylglutathione hydrolase FrmB
VETRSFDTPSLGVSKKYVVYLPKGYDDSEARFPVLYLLHGLGGRETNWVDRGGLVASAKAVDVPYLVVMPDGDDGFYVNGLQKVDYEACLREKPPWDPSETPATYCVKRPRYEDYVAFDLVQEIDRSYRTRAARESRGVAGLSMGGFGALQLAMRHPDLFSASASHSGMASLRYAGPRPFAPGRATTSTPADFGAQYPAKFRKHVASIFGASPDKWEAHDPTALVAKMPPDALAFYVDCGAQDDFHFQDHAAHLHEVLEAKGLAHEHHVVPGRHTWAAWKAQLPSSLRFFAARLAR